MPSVPTNAMTPARGIRPGQPAEPVHVPGAGRVLGDAGLEEQQRLVAAVVEHVVEAGQQQERPQRPLAVSEERHRGAERGHDDPDVLDRGVGQEALDVPFPERVQDPDSRGKRADAPW